ncbi:dTDP-4-dehydrorhamnose 3,5-epimerase [Psychroflexus lacisalsi]|uniref:dTDP-4-dehydrorhamnose 3,5-epimerase n=1 Tax=Psychroflexus lacisalsi TaxID=503928 RepID=A0ABN1K223_9FLAO|nr:dTDP-4-dehydrorhamnose 3,5-epimerase [Psychroflexus lacisalsi]MBZ9621092.1 dTDP-4-dehydrorhamnose 3,5-epimerase [Psychroflexus lacisalsi]
MTVKQTPLKDCFVIEPKVFKDKRGSFFESFNYKTFKKNTGLEIDFVQDNQSISQYGAIRGLHFQTGEFAQAKLIRVAQGEVLDVVVDMRPDSETYLKQFGYTLTGENNHQLFVPKGFAHGFATLSSEVIFVYKCDNYYDKASESGILFNDKTLAIDWQIPKKDQIISEKDEHLPTLEAYLNS